MGQTGSNANIFVSHSHADNDFCLRLVGDLRKLYGDDAVWFDNAGGLAPGDEWWAKIRTELRQRAIFIVVLSPEAVASRWVDDEISLAWSQRNSPEGKLIIPVIHQKCKPRDDINTLRNKVSFVDPVAYEAAFAKVRRQIEAFKQKQVQQAERAAREQARIAERRGAALAHSLPTRNNVAGVGALLLVISVITVLLFARSNPSLGSSRLPTSTPFPTAIPTFTPTPTPTFAQLAHEAAPGPCQYPAAWDTQLPIVSDTAQLSSQNLSGAFICHPDSVEMVTHARSEGDFGSIRMTFAPAAYSLPLKHKYQITVSGWPPHVSGALLFTVDGATLEFQVSPQLQVYAFVQCSTSPQSGPLYAQSYPSSFEVLEQFDGTKLQFSANSRSVMSCSFTGAHSDDQSQLQVSYEVYSADATRISALSLKNFIFTDMS